MTNRRRLGALLALLPVALIAAACGDDDDVTTDRGAPPSGDRAEVVVQVTVDGGFVPVEVALRTVPMITVLSDGTVITPAPTTMIYPGPAITPLQSGTIAADDLDALLEQAREDGLLDGPLEFGDPPVADLPKTRVTIRVDGETVTHEAYALQEEGGVGADEAENRARLRAFVDAVTAASGGDQLWSPGAIAATVVGPYTANPEIGEQSSIDWPLDTLLVTDGQFPCTLVEGDDAKALLTALADANELTPWVVDGAEYAVAFRPVVPGAPGCE